MVFCTIHIATAGGAYFGIYFTAMEIIIANDYGSVCELAAEKIMSVVAANPHATLGLATGSTPLGVYARLVSACARGALSLAGCTSFNLDEYVGIGADNPHGYAYYMRENLFGKTDIDIDNTHLPCGTAKDLAAECARYTALLAKNRRDIQLLGLGSDGHIAFNEPDTPFDTHTHVAELAESTVKDNSRLFAKPEDVPRYALTMGIADIIDADKILILACGANKARAVYGMVKGEVTERVPASVLQRHPDVTVILDKAAAELL